jgi:hypothetical protein
MRCGGWATRTVGSAQPTAEDIISGLESIEAGQYTEYEGREGLKKLADGVKARGRGLLGNFPVAGRLIERNTDGFWLLGEHPDILHIFHWSPGSEAGIQKGQQVN